MSEQIIYPVQPFFVLDSEHYYKKMLPKSAVAHFYGFHSREQIESEGVFGIVSGGIFEIDR